jgi:hypothetical protein
MSEDPPTSPPPRSTWQTIRKRAAPLGLVLALVWLGTRSCSDEPVKARVLIGVGAAPVVELRATAHRPDGEDALAHFEQRDLNGPAPVWRLELAPGSYRLVFVVALRDEPTARRFERRIEVTDGADIRVDLSRDLQ